MQQNCTAHLQKIATKRSDCLVSCSGLIVTSYSRSEPKKTIEDTICNCYKRYTKWSPFPSELKGKTRLCLYLCGIIINNLKVCNS